MDQWLRFKNFILDTGIYILLITLFFLILRNQIKVENARWISVLVYFLYYAGFEFFLHQTPGKMITRTKVVSLDVNKKVYFFSILTRTLMRFIPFDILSFLFYSRGLHDWISGTTIVKI